MMRVEAVGGAGSQRRHGMPVLSIANLNDCSAIFRCRRRCRIDTVQGCGGGLRQRTGRLTCGAPDRPNASGHRGLEPGALGWLPIAARAEIISARIVPPYLTSDRRSRMRDRGWWRVMSGGLSGAKSPAPLTPEQRRQKQVEQDKLRADALAAEEQRQQDRILLSRYRATSTSRRREACVAAREDLIAGANQAIAGCESSRPPSRKEFTRKPLPFNLRPAEESDNPNEQRKQGSRVRRSTINAKYDAALKRYRELRGSEIEADRSYNGSVVTAPKRHARDKRSPVASAALPPASATGDTITHNHV